MAKALEHPAINHQKRKHGKIGVAGTNRLLEKSDLCGVSARDAEKSFMCTCCGPDGGHHANTVMTAKQSSVPMTNRQRVSLIIPL